MSILNFSGAARAPQAPATTAPAAAPATTPAATAAGNWISDATEQNFMQAVIETSMQVPVIVDFWAPWCGPCKQLTPLLEKVVNAAQGTVRLVKVNIDQAPMLAQQLRIQSVPMVYAFVGGQPVDGFAGALPEQQLRAFVQRLTGAAAGAQDPAADLAAGLAQMSAEIDALLAGGAVDQARQAAAAIAAHLPDNAEAQALLLRTLIAAGDVAAAEAHLTALPDPLKQHAAITPAATAIALLKESPARPLAEVQRAVDASPNDHALRLELARALFAAGQPDAAVDACLHSFAADRSWNDEAARKLLLRLFDALGPMHEITRQGRRKLSSLMFA